MSMSSIENQTLTDALLDEVGKRKRLGQYFTGTRLGRVLAALAGADKAVSVIDPMSGHGDLLAACVELGADPSGMGALEIDPEVLESCRQRLPQVACVLGNAFDPESLRKLPHLQWDLVIANPPYVRYQSLSTDRAKGFPIPGATDIRKGLLSEIEMLPALDENDKNLFRKMVQGYSGLADLAVPSWILCAGLVAPRGRLALVVPQSWLSRNYAAVVHYLLLRWFEIEFLVEDAHVAWFSDVQVKTTLLVARRIPRKQSAFNFSDGLSSFLRIVVSGKASGAEGPFSRLMQGTSNPEQSFAGEARHWLSSRTQHEDDVIRAFPVSLAQVASNLRHSCTKQKWFLAMGEESAATMAVVPHELNEWLARSPSAPTPVPLSSLGVHVGQGLRTGANAFFYGEKVSEGMITFKKLFPTTCWALPEAIALPVVRGQRDLPSGFLVSAKMTPGRVLDLRRYALPEDIRSGGDLAATAYLVMPDRLADFVRAAGNVSFGSLQETKRIWELSAVAPNVRHGRIHDGLPPAFWYMLPEFARRHRPDLLMARINHVTPKAYLNDGACIIDANFSTLWTENGLPTRYALLALLNSAWTGASLEHIGAVMGGGALKVEATHLRTLSVPRLQADTFTKLARLGKRLAFATQTHTISDLINTIDAVVATAALGRMASHDDIQALRALSETARSDRKRHKRKGDAH